jgi:hypothetical protein
MAFNREQAAFLSTGGVLRQVLEHKYEKGELVRPEDYQFAEYPKCLNLPLGTREIPRATETVKGVTLQWTEVGEAIAPMPVRDADEEAAVREAFAVAQDLNIEIEEDWSPERLLEVVNLVRSNGKRAPRRAPVQEVSSQAAAPSADAGRIAALEAQIAALVAVVNAPKGADDKPRRPHRKKVVPVSVATEDAATAPGLLDEAA